MLPGFRNFVYPDICPACRKLPTADELAICAACDRCMDYIHGRTCPKCGAELLTEHSICRECEGNPRNWEYAVSAFRFEGQLRHCLHRFKYNGDVALAPYLGESAWSAWKRRYPDVSVDCICPVPLHWFRRFTRGYNQSELVGQEIARAADLPIKLLLRRRRWTAPQAGLSRTKRRGNLSNAFEVRGDQDVADLTVLLIDDVMTTGSTLHECTRYLYKAGVAHVHILTVARR